jgi:hypothetical protein
MISGFRHLRSTWRRSTWNTCAGLVRLTDLEVVLRRELQEALEARATSAPALALEAVRQHHHQAAEAVPLVLARER